MSRPWFKNYDANVPHTFNVPEFLPRDLFNWNTEKSPDKPYLILDDLILSYNICNSMSRQLADSLRKLGVKKGDRLAIMSPNIPQYVISVHACHKLGVIIVPVNPMYTVPEITHQFIDSGTETVIVMAPFASKVIEAKRSKKTFIKNIIVIQNPKNLIEIEKAPDIFNFDEIIKQGNDKEPDIKLSQQDIALLQYTGGTTGAPKGCCLNYYNEIALTYSMCHWWNVLVPYREIIALTALPLYHAYGFNSNFRLVAPGGGTMVLVPLPTTDNILEAINKHEPNIFGAVPAMMIGINNHPDTPKSKVQSIKVFCSGGSPLPVEVIRNVEQTCNNIIVEGYGMSETSGCASASPCFHDRKPGSAGLPWPNTDVKIVDLETGTKDMAANELGELIINGPQVMTSYWNKPEDTAEVLRDGWLYTGDIAYLDEDGYIFLVDRKKDLIISSGFNVYPREVDEVLFTHPKILNTCTVGIPDQKRGETVKAFIVLKEGENISKEEILAFCNERLAPYKVPKLIEFTDSLPLTASGKPMRVALRQMEENRKN